MVTFSLYRAYTELWKQVKKQGNKIKLPIGDSDIDDLIFFLK